MAHHETDNPAYQIYMAEMARHTVPTIEEEVELLTRVKQGDLKAREEIFERNMRLVVSVALKNRGRGVPVMDLISEGNIGLLKAIDRYRLDKGAKLSTYATFWIKQAIRRTIANDSRDVRVPVHEYELHRQIIRAIDDLTRELGERPTDEEIAEYLEIPVEKVQFSLKRVSSSVHTALDSTIGEDGETTLHEVFEDEQAVSPESFVMLREEFPHLVREVRQLLEAVYASEGDPRDREMFMMFYGVDKIGITLTLEEVSQAFGITRERVRQIKEKIWEKVKEKFPHLRSGEDHFIRLLGRISRMENATGLAIDVPTLLNGLAAHGKEVQGSVGRPKGSYAKAVLVLKRFRSGEIKPVKKETLLETIIEAVSLAYGIDAEELTGLSSERPYIWPRKVALYIAREEFVPKNLLINRFAIQDRTAITRLSSVVAEAVADGKNVVADDVVFIHNTIKNLWGSV